MEKEHQCSLGVRGITGEVVVEDTMCILSSGDRSLEPLLKPMLKKHAMTGRESKASQNAD